MALVAILVATIPLASAFGVTTHYWNDKPLIMHPGQTMDIDVELQNMVGDEDIRLQAEITEGSEIATLIDPDSVYAVPLGRKDIKVNIRVAVPENVALEDSYTIQVSFKQVAEEEGKMVQMTASVGATIPVVIKSIEEVPPVVSTPTEEVPVEQGEASTAEEKTSPALAMILLLAILAAGIGYLVFKKMKGYRKK